MSIKKSCLLFSMLLLAGSGNAALADEASHRQAVARLFELTQMQQKIDESVDNLLALQLAQSPELRDHEAVVREFLVRNIGWQSLEEAVTDMYMQEFTEAELDEMNAFYSSPTGKKVIERLPVLVQMRNQLASKRLQEHIGELRNEIQGDQEQQEQPAQP